MQNNNLSPEAEAVSRFLKDHGITQAKLAGEYGCSPASMSQFLSGVRPIPDMGRIVAALSACTGEDVHLEIHAVGFGGDLVRYDVSITAPAGE